MLRPFDKLPPSPRLRRDKMEDKTTGQAGFWRMTICEFLNLSVAYVADL